ncbi:hypothetical protein C7999DRAFT_41193 [Corynascus novoguineensis]|uniref:Uncharacterized protein n=1 Tax=Corynascus novoguineensis TaxID=1126955 RepID=A0AAN7CUL3_9PEZI|nr:hypothetical protein C7999DRAFT_41193 [Corynascus novoguineensis]
MAVSDTSRSSQETPKCQASIEASVDFLNLSLGRLSIPAEACLFSLLNQCFAKTKAIFNLTDHANVLGEPSSLERILNSIFDTGSLPLVTEKSVRITAGLDDHDRSCLFLQAVAGMVLIFQRLSQAGGVISNKLLSRELQLLAESEQRSAVLDKIGSSHVFSSCYTKNSVVDFLMASIDGHNDEPHECLALNETGEYLLSNSVAWVSDRPCKNMGLPWGFTIMSLN